MDPRSQVLTTPILLEQILTSIFKGTDELLVLFHKGLKTSSPPAPEYHLAPAQYNQAYKNRRGQLYPCIFVNKLWFYETARILWRHWNDRAANQLQHFIYVFEQIQPERRQFYANLIRTAELLAIELSDLVQRAQVVFEGIHFPKLAAVHLLVPGIWYDETHLVEVPLFDAPQLSTLVIDAKYDYTSRAPMYVVSQNEWRDLFNLITVSYQLFGDHGEISNRNRVLGPLSKHRKREAQG